MEMCSAPLEAPTGGYRHPKSPGTDKGIRSPPEIRQMTARIRVYIEKQQTEICNGDDSSACHPM